MITEVLLSESNRNPRTDGSFSRINSLFKDTFPLHNQLEATPASPSAIHCVFKYWQFIHNTHPAGIICSSTWFDFPEQLNTTLTYTQDDVVQVSLSGCVH